MAFPRTLAPGQQYTQPGDPAWGDRPVTVARLDAARHGFPLVTLRFSDGRELVAYVAQVEAAIAAGHLVPFRAVTDEPLARAA